MPATPSRRGDELGLRVALIATLSVIAFTALSYSGALKTGVTSNPDEAAHYVTSLMIFRYLSDGLSTEPLQFAENYYLHYPKVAFGVWPPMFHLALASWMFMTGPSQASALFLIAITLVALGYLIFRSLQPRVGIPFAALAAVWFVLLPTVQRTADSILLDVPCTMLMVGAAIAFGRFLESQRRRDAVIFALLSGAALLTKNNALSLALLPLLAIAFTRKWSILRSWSLWMTPLIAAAMCVPWYILTWDLFTFVASMGGHEWTAPKDNLILLAREPGFVFVPLAILGVWSTVGRGTNNGFWNSLAALIASVWLFHSAIYMISAPRYMLPAYAGLVVFCVAGVHWLATRFALRTVRAQVVLATVTLAAFLGSGFHIQKKPRRGFVEAANVMVSAGLRENGTALVCSDPIGEGSFVAAVATSESVPRSIVLRASKVLAESSWVGEHYVAKYNTPESLMKAIDGARVEFIAMDEVDESPHYKTLVRALEHSNDWAMVREVVSSEPTPDHSTVRIYRRVTPLPPGPPTFEIDLSESLGLKLRR